MHSSESNREFVPLRVRTEKVIIHTMKIIRLALLLSVTMCLTGCFTVDTAPLKWSGEEHVVMRNYGWSFFNWIPLVCGNADETATMGMALFRDDVTLEKVQARYMRYANGRTVETPVYLNKDSNIIEVFGIPIPYVLCYKEINLSGTIK